MDIKKVIDYIEDLSEESICERCTSSKDAGEARQEQYRVVEFIKRINRNSEMYKKGDSVA